MRKHRLIHQVILTLAFVPFTGIRTTSGAPALARYHVTDLGALNGIQSAGVAINASGQVTGYSTVSDSLYQHAFVWTPTTPNGASGAMYDLGTIGGNDSYGWGVNASGQVTGAANTTNDAATHAFLYDGTLHDLGTLGGNSSEGLGINRSGQVIGYSYLPGNTTYHAFSWSSSGGMVDLNTLIDPTLGWELNTAAGINDAGQITGSGLIDGQSHGFLLTPVPEPATLALALTGFGAALLLMRGFRRIAKPSCLVWALSAVSQVDAAQYVVTDLGALGGTDSLGWGINARGQVTGYAATTGDAAIKPFLWSPTTSNGVNGTMKDLGALGGDFGWGIGINSRGQVSGVAATSQAPAEHAMLWNPTTANGTTGTMYDLGSLGGTYSQGTGINDSGQLTGYADLTGDTVSHAMMWKPTMPGGTTGTMHDLGSLGGTFTIGWDINATGQVVGTSDTTDNAANRAFLWNPTTPNETSGMMHDLGTLGGTSSDGSGINDMGQVAGSSMNEDEKFHAFLWTPTTPGGASGNMLDLGTLGGDESYAYSVSADGEVVGLSYVPAQVSNYSHAFLYASDTGMLDLNTRIDPLSGWELLDADDINDFGQITGQGLIDDEYHAFLLTPAQPGDVNLDGAVDIFDVNTVSARWGTSGPQGDANGDGTVDIFDVNLISANWTVGGEAAAVPEPASIALVLLAAPLVLLSVVRRRRGMV